MVKSTNKRSVSVVIPPYNEQTTIMRSVTDVQERPCALKGVILQQTPENEQSGPRQPDSVLSVFLILLQIGAITLAFIVVLLLVYTYGLA